MRGGLILTTIVAFFKEDKWDFEWVEGMPVLSMAFAGRSGQWTCFAQARENQEQFVFYSICPFRVAPEQMPRAMEFVTRANYGMVIGNFELDMTDGEVRYKTSIDVEGDRLTPALVRQVVYANVLMMDRYLPGFMSVIYGGTDPQTAIDHAENELEDGGEDDDENDIINVWLRSNSSFTPPNAGLN